MYQLLFNIMSLINNIIVSFLKAAQSKEYRVKEAFIIVDDLGFMPDLHLPVIFGFRFFYFKTTTFTSILNI